MNIFDDKLVKDDRAPSFLFQMGDYSFSFHAPRTEFFLQVIVLLLLQIAIANIISVVCYKRVLKEQQSTASALLVFGLLLPIIIWSPFELMNLLDIQSPVLRMGLVPLPICVGLKCLQAYFGYTPRTATLSLQNYVYYMGFLVEPKFVGDAVVKATLDSFVKMLASHLYWWFLISIWTSILAPYNYEPFSTSQDSYKVFWAWEVAQIANNFLTAVLLSLSLSFSLSGVAALVELVGGFQSEHVVDNPMFCSMSPSDFWGRRWNRLVHAGLKNGVYKPVRSYTASRSAATLATFLTSGLIHEYVWFIIFYVNAHQSPKDCYKPSWGKNLLFFGWNGMLLLIEYSVGPKRWNALTENFPRPVVTLLVVLMALPVGHLFTGDMVYGGYFEALQLALPMLVVSKQQS